MELVQRPLPAPGLLVLVGEGRPLRGHEGQGEGSGGLGLAVTQHHVAVDVPWLGELLAAISTLVRFALHLLVLFDVQFQVGQGVESFAALGTREQLHRLDLLHEGLSEVT